jgi:hypothetical protein
VKQQVNLKELEKKAFKSTFQDGIWDIYLGLLMLNMCIMPWLVETVMSIQAVIITGFSILGIALFVFFAGKKKITVPRLGLIKFGSERKAKMNKVKLVLLLSVLVGVFLLIATQGLGSSTELPTIIIIFAANVIIVFSIGAYYFNVPRFYFYGLFMAIPFPLGIVLRNNDVPIITVISICSFPSLVMLCIGIVLFIQFVKKYPTPAEDFYNVMAQ